jgi:hypothetical protein
MNMIHHAQSRPKPTVILEFPNTEIHIPVFSAGPTPHP